ncbi:MAG: hypothetical protein SGJ20_09875 [Planctomycetota bacterium]|nr:hypothetical protein [Planctomycetota bacterium]
MRIANFAAAICNVFAISNDSAAVFAKRIRSLKSCAHLYQINDALPGNLGGLTRLLRGVVRPDAALVPVSTQMWHPQTYTTAMRSVESVERS